MAARVFSDQDLRAKTGRDVSKWTTKEWHAYLSGWSVQRLGGETEGLGADRFWATGFEAAAMDKRRRAESAE